MVIRLTFPVYRRLQHAYARAIPDRQFPRPDSQFLIRAPKKENLVSLKPFINFVIQSAFQMKKIQEYEQDIASIRSMMERSVKFISLSGLSGVLAGLYALGGSAAAYYTVQYPESPLQTRSQAIQTSEALTTLVLIATIVLIASISTGLWLSNKKAKKHGLKLWNSASRQLVFNMAVPLVAGGIFILIMLYTGHFGLAAPASLIFYGIALIQVSPNTFDEVRYLGFSEIVLGLISAILPGYGLIFWAVGFGVLHIVYGAIMYNKYDK